MSSTSALYKKCHDLFVGYPLAATAVNRDGRTISSMILMLENGDGARYFVLWHDCGIDGSPYSLCRWRAGDIVAIGADGGAVPDEFVHAVTSGVPIPRHGSVFGWTRTDAVTALVVMYAKYSPALPEPRWTVMPLADIPEPQWPPFTDECFLGHWFWEHYEAGDIVSLS